MDIPDGCKSWKWLRRAVYWFDHDSRLARQCQTFNDCLRFEPYKENSTTSPDDYTLIGVGIDQARPFNETHHYFWHQTAELYAQSLLKYKRVKLVFDVKEIQEFMYVGAGTVPVPQLLDLFHVAGEYYEKNIALFSLIRPDTSYNPSANYWQLFTAFDLWTWVLTLLSFIVVRGVWVLSQRFNQRLQRWKRRDAYKWCEWFDYVRFIIAD